MYKILLSLIFSFMLFVSLECFATSPELYMTPSSVLRKIEGRYGKWYLLKEKDGDKPCAFGVRIYTFDTLILFKGSYRLVRSSQKEETIISESSVPTNFKNEIYFPTISIKNNPKGRSYLNLETGKEVLSFGAYLNIDKIFHDNKWCKIIIVDDMSSGYIFSRDNDKYMDLGYKECSAFNEYLIADEGRDYSDLNSQRK